MKIAIALIGIALAAVLVVSATMGAETLVPGGGESKAKLPGKFPGNVIRTNGRAKIMPTGYAPPTLKGTQFKAGENVTVRLDARTKKVRASSSGTFSVSFRGRADRCHGMTVTAVGDKGSRAGFQLSEFMCAMSGAQ